MAEFFQLPDSQPQNTTFEAPTLFLNGRTIDEIRAHNRAEFEKIAPRIRKQYGVSDSWSVREIIKAEREQKLCATCSGEPCEKPVGKTFDDYEITADNQRAVKLAKAFVKCKPSAGLYIFGGYGTGKTFLASIIAQNFMQDLRRVVFGDVPNLMELIKQSFDSDAQNPLETYCNCDLLILDDIGAGQITEWNVGQLYQIINARYNAELPVIITSNLDFDGLKKNFRQLDRRQNH